MVPSKPPATSVASRAGMDTVILSSDKDLLQLVNDHVSVYASKKGISDILSSIYEADYVSIPLASEPKSEYVTHPDKLSKSIKSLKKNMIAAAKRFDFEEAARLRDRIKYLEKIELDHRDSSNY